MLSSIVVGSFRELGPPDLCHIIKVNAKPGIKEVCWPLASAIFK